MCGGRLARAWLWQGRAVGGFVQSLDMWESCRRVARTRGDGERNCN